MVMLWCIANCAFLLGATAVSQHGSFDDAFCPRVSNFAAQDLDESTPLAMFQKISRRDRFEVEPNSSTPQLTPSAEVDIDNSGDNANGKISALSKIDSNSTIAANAIDSETQKRSLDEIGSEESWHMHGYRKKLAWRLFLFLSFLCCGFVFCVLVVCALTSVGAEEPSHFRHPEFQPHRHEEVLHHPVREADPFLTIPHTRTSWEHEQFSHHLVEPLSVPLNVKQLSPRLVEPHRMSQSLPLHQEQFHPLTVESFAMPSHVRQFSPHLVEPVSPYMHSSPASQLVRLPFHGWRPNSPHLQTMPAKMEYAGVAQAAPSATMGFDTNLDGHANLVVTGPDRNHDGIPDILEASNRNVGASRLPVALGTGVGFPTTLNSPLIQGSNAPFSIPLNSLSLAPSTFGQQPHVRALSADGHRPMSTTRGRSPIPRALPTNAFSPVSAKQILPGHGDNALKNYSLPPGVCLKPGDTALQYAGTLRSVGAPLHLSTNGLVWPGTGVGSALRLA